jgi:hypothetical protein
MTIQDIILDFENIGYIGLENMELLANNAEIRIQLLEYIRQKPHRVFVKEFLFHTMKCRRKYQESPLGFDEEGLGSGDNIMFACYLLGLHQQIEDCLLIWEAKDLDFDMACYFDIQLVLFSGVAKTIEYLQSSQLSTAQKALEYIQSCQIDIVEDTEAYFLPDNIPFYI